MVLAVPFFSFLLSLNFFANATTEKLRITYDDGRILEFDSGSKTGVAFDLRNLADPERIVSIEHNHFRSTDLSPSDKWILDYLRGKGFQGRFIVWLTKVGK